MCVLGGLDGDPQIGGGEETGKLRKVSHKPGYQFSFSFFLFFNSFFFSGSISLPYFTTASSMSSSSSVLSVTYLPCLLERLKSWCCALLCSAITMWTSQKVVGSLGQTYGWMAITIYTNGLFCFSPNALWVGVSSVGCLLCILLLGHLFSSRIYLCFCLTYRRSSIDGRFCWSR